MLNTEEQNVHERAVQFAKQLTSAEAPLLAALTEASKLKLHKKFERTGLFYYARDILKLDEPTARRFITVAKKCADFPQVLQAIEANKFPVSKAARFVSVITEKNVDNYIEYAANHSYKDIDKKVADEHPEKKRKSNHKPIGNGRTRASYDFKQEMTDDLTKLAKRLNLDPAELLEKAYYEYAERHDPIRKAERAKSRKQPEPANQEPKKLCVSSISITKRKPIPAATKHAVTRRDQGQCTHIHENGERCDQTKWIDIHHIVHVADGGTNELDNLTTLCTFHHELRHQLEFDIGRPRKFQYWKSAAAVR